MLYQLPNGKVINIAVDDYLNLTDEDIQMLIALNYGEYPSSYWYGSCIETIEIVVKQTHDTSMYSLDEQDEYLGNASNIDINNIPDEDIDFTDL